MSEAPRSGARAFPETHWSQILRAADARDPDHRAHLDRLLRRYWKPVYHYVRAMRPLSTDDAQDLTQAFFVMMLDRVDLASLTPERGSFRGFLKTALRRFVISHERRPATQAQRRTTPLFPYAEAEADAARSMAAGGRPVSPEEAFDEAWRRQLMREMLSRLEHALEAEDKRLYLEIFRAYCVDPAPDVSYDSLARAHGLKPDDVRNYLRVVRQRGREILRKLVRDYLLPGESLDEELRVLLGGP